MIKVWNITPGRKDEPNVLYAGAQPASFFISKDRGETWELNEGLYDHPQRGQWNPGNGGLCLHTILLDPTDLKRMYIAVSAAANRALIELEEPPSGEGQVRLHPLIHQFLRETSRAME